MEICSYRLAQVDRKWPGRHMYCLKHNYGPMDSWYNCEECANEVCDEFELYQQSDEYKEGWQLIRAGKYAEGQQKIICPETHGKYETYISKGKGEQVGDE